MIIDLSLPTVSAQVSVRYILEYSQDSLDSCQKGNGKEPE